jgi:hypothetical protein
MRDKNKSRDRSLNNCESRRQDSIDQTSMRSESYQRGQVSSGRLMSHERQVQRWNLPGFVQPEKKTLETKNSPSAGAKAGDNGVSLSVEDMSRTEPSLQKDSPEGTTERSRDREREAYNNTGLPHVEKGNKLQFRLRPSQNYILL